MTTSEPIFFEWLEVEGFRGFADRQRLQLDASVVILSGPNGTGKTSFFDAVQWLLIGTLERLEPWRVRRNAEHVVNQYTAAEGGKAVVAASLRVDGRTIELRRTGRYDASQLEWRDEQRVLFEAEAERALAEALTPLGRMSLQRSLLSSGLLQQDVVRDVLEDKPGERYEQLATILGLNMIAGFPTAARKRADQLADDGGRARKVVADLETEARAVRDRIAALRTRVEQAPDAAAARAEAAARLRANETVFTLRGDVPLSGTDAQEMALAARRAADDIAEVLAGDRRYESLAREQPPDPRDVEQLRLAAESASVALAEARERAAEAERVYLAERELSSRLERLAAEALPLLGPECPVCQQTIDIEHVTAHLEELMRDGAPRFAAAERVRNDEASRAADRERLAADAMSAFAETAARSDQILQARAYEDARLEQIARLVDRVRPAFIFAHERDLLAGNYAALEAAADALDETWRVLRELATALEFVVESAAISSAEEQLASVEARIAEARQTASRASAAEDDARTLQRAAVRAAAAVTEDRFEILRPVIQDVYERLSPHPTFTGLRFAINVYRERGVASPLVTDPERELTADPLLVFSSSQANVVALSAFLALGWAASEDAMPFLLLDDPLQSLDDVNALGFADLCRHMRGRRQLIVSTHDPRLASLLERKLAPRREQEHSRRLQFVAWSRTGPLIDPVEIASQVDQGARRALVRS